jgi:hypothetical protein
VDVHRYIDFGTAVGVIGASLATGESMAAEQYHTVVKTTALINDLVDFRGDTWRGQLA